MNINMRGRTKKAETIRLGDLYRFENNASTFMIYIITKEGTSNPLVGIGYTLKWFFLFFVFSH